MRKLGYRPQGIPVNDAQALGPRRAAELALRVEDRLLNRNSTPLTPAELAGDAMKFEPSQRALNRGLAHKVTELERRREELLTRLWDPTPGRGPGRTIRRQMARVDRELAELATRPDHPDRWVAEHGRHYADALAARREKLRDAERAHRQMCAERPDAGRERLGHDEVEAGFDLW